MKKLENDLLVRIAGVSLGRVILHCYCFMRGNEKFAHAWAGIKREFSK